MPPPLLPYRTLVGLWWRRKDIQARVIAAWLTPIAKAVGRRSL